MTEQEKANLTKSLGEMISKAITTAAPEKEEKKDEQTDVAEITKAVTEGVLTQLQANPVFKALEGVQKTEEPDEQAEVADAEEAGDEPPRTVRVAGGGGGGGGGAEESEASGPTRGHPGAGGGGAEPVGGAASDEGPDIDRVEVGGGAKSDKPPKKKRPLRSRLSWLAFGLLSGWLLLGYGRYMVLGGSR